MTTPPHPPLDIPALRRLEAAATRGEWAIGSGPDGDACVYSVPGSISPDGETGEDTRLLYAGQANAALIVAARNNLVGLMDRVEELEATIQELTQDVLRLRRDQGIQLRNKIMLEGGHTGRSFSEAQLPQYPEPFPSVIVMREQLIRFRNGYAQLMLVVADLLKKDPMKLCMRDYIDALFGLGDPTPAAPEASQRSTKEE